MKETIKAKEEDVAEKYLRDNNVDVDFYVEKGLNEIKKYRTNKDIVMEKKIIHPLFEKIKVKKLSKKDIDKIAINAYTYTY